MKCECNICGMTMENAVIHLAEHHEKLLFDEARELVMKTFDEVD